MSNRALESTRTEERAGTDERLGKLYMFVAMVVSGTIGYFVTQSGQTPFNVVLFRCSIGAIGLSAWCLFRGYFRSIRLDRAAWVKLILGALTLVANWCFLFTAYRMTSVGITTVVYNVQPFLLLISGFFIRREVPSRSAKFLHAPPLRGCCCRSRACSFLPLRAPSTAGHVTWTE